MRHQAAPPTHYHPGGCLMPFSLTEAGVYVGTASRDSLEMLVDRELKKLDPDLFLDKEYEPNGGYVFYCVKHWVGEKSPVGPVVPVLEWRDLRGPRPGPRPLTVSLVNQIRWDDSDWRDRQQRAINARQKAEKKRKETADELWDDVLRYWESGKVDSVILPRGPDLRMARDKQRARGEKI